MKRTLKQALALALGALMAASALTGCGAKPAASTPASQGGAFRAPPPTPTVKR